MKLTDERIDTHAMYCARCGQHKHTPLRIGWMGGYVCLTCIDKELEARDPAAQPDERAAFIRDVSLQKPEKPDHWSTCGQCERNIERAQDLLEARAASQPTATGGHTPISDAALKRFGQSQYRDGYAQAVHDMRDRAAPPQAGLTGEQILSIAENHHYIHPGVDEWWEFRNESEIIAFARALLAAEPARAATTATEQGESTCDTYAGTAEAQAGSANMNSATGATVRAEEQLRAAAQAIRPRKSGKTGSTYIQRKQVAMHSGRCKAQHEFALCENEVCLRSKVCRAVGPKVGG